MNNEAIPIIQYLKKQLKNSGYYVSSNKLGLDFCHIWQDYLGNGNPEEFDMVGGLEIRGDKILIYLTPFSNEDLRNEYYLNDPFCLKKTLNKIKEHSSNGPHNMAFQIAYEWS